MIRLPLTAVHGWIVAFAVRGVINLFFPLGWALLRNHPPGTSLRPVQVITPVPFGGLAIATWPETFLASLIGVALLVVSALLARPAVAVDTWLARALLGPGALDRRVRELERIRSLAVDGARQDGQERLAAGLVQDRAQLGGPAAQLRAIAGLPRAFLSSSRVTSAAGVRSRSSSWSSAAWVRSSSRNPNRGSQGRIRCLSPGSRSMTSKSWRELAYRPFPPGCSRSYWFQIRVT